VLTLRRFRIASLVVALGTAAPPGCGGRTAGSDAGAGGGEGGSAEGGSPEGSLDNGAWRDAGPETSLGPVDSSSGGGVDAPYDGYMECDPRFGCSNVGGQCSFCSEGTMIACACQSGGILSCAATGQSCAPCPATQPVPNSACDLDGLMCPYNWNPATGGGCGGWQCTCPGQAATWTCTAGACPDAAAGP
jgi:hypothetical protein